MEGRRKEGDNEKGVRIKLLLYYPFVTDFLMLPPSWSEWTKHRQ